MQSPLFLHCMFVVLFGFRCLCLFRYLPVSLPGYLFLEHHYQKYLVARCLRRKSKSRQQPQQQAQRLSLLSIPSFYLFYFSKLFNQKDSIIRPYFVGYFYANVVALLCFLYSSSLYLYAANLDCKISCMSSYMDFIPDFQSGRKLYSSNPYMAKIARYTAYFFFFCHYFLRNPIYLNLIVLCSSIVIILKYAQHL